MGFFDSVYNFFKDRNVIADSDTVRAKDPDLFKVVAFNEEYAAELTTEASETATHTSYSTNGVELTDIKDSPNTLKLTYNGILAKNGAEEIYTVIGFGNNLNWEDTNYYKMVKIDNQTFELTFPVNRDGNINIAFKDSSYNWDNNAGINYTYFENPYKGSH